MNCELCGCPVEVVGRNTQHYQPVREVYQVRLEFRDSEGRFRYYASPLFSSYGEAEAFQNEVNAAAEDPGYAWKTPNYPVVAKPKIVRWEVLDHWVGPLEAFKEYLR
jgi:hypothetical protein